MEYDIEEEMDNLDMKDIPSLKSKKENSTKQSTNITSVKHGEMGTQPQDKTSGSLLSCKSIVTLDTISVLKESLSRFDKQKKVTRQSQSYLPSTPLERKKSKETSQKSRDDYMMKNLITGDIVNYDDMQTLKRRQEYIKMEGSRVQLSEDDFNKKVEIGSWSLLSMITNVISIEEVLIFLADQIQNAYDLDMTFENGRSFLVYAVARGEPLLVEKLISMKPTLLNKLDDLGRTPLHYAVMFKKSTIVNLLVEFGCEPDTADLKGQTPLHFSAMYSTLEMYLFLRCKGTIGLREDIFGMRPLDYFSNCDDYSNMCKMEGVTQVEQIGGWEGCRSVMGEKSTSTNANSIPNVKSSKKVVVSNNKMYFDRKRSLFHVLKVVRQTEEVEKEDYYEDLYGGQISKKYMIEEAKRKAGDSSIFEGEILNNPPSFMETEEIERMEREMELLCPKVTSEDFLVHSVIGKGSFGEIYCVSYKGREERFAMKSYEKSKMLTNNLIRFLFIEKKVMTNFKHPFIVRLHFSFQNTERLFLVMEYCEKRDLSKCVKKLQEYQLKILACEIILGIKALHDYDIIHRDLKPENILIASDGHIKIADFGLAKEKLKPNELTTTFCGSIAYLPPEIISRKGHNKTVDWYLLGEILYEMMIGIPPYYDGSKDTLFDNILNMELVYPDNKIKLSDSLKDLISRLLDRDINKRLGSKYGAKEVMNHHFFVGIDWRKVYNKGYTLFEPTDLKSYQMKSTDLKISSKQPSPNDTNFDLPYWSFTRPQIIKK